MFFNIASNADDCDVPTRRSALGNRALAALIWTSVMRPSLTEVRMAALLVN